MVSLIALSKSGRGRSPFSRPPSPFSGTTPLSVSARPDLGPFPQDIQIPQFFVLASGRHEARFLFWGFPPLSWLGLAWAMFSFDVVAHRAPSYALQSRNFFLLGFPRPRGRKPIGDAAQQWLCRTGACFNGRCSIFLHDLVRRPRATPPGENRVSWGGLTFPPHIFVPVGRTDAWNLLSLWVSSYARSFVRHQTTVGPGACEVCLLFPPPCTG